LTGPVPLGHRLDMNRFEISGEFPATHRIRIDARGTLEPLHAHAWRIRALLHLDDAPASGPGEVVERAREILEAWIDRHRGRCFNDVPPFDEVNPTAEEVARVLSRHLEDRLPAARIVQVEVGEALGFSAAYWPRGEPTTADDRVPDDPTSTGADRSSPRFSG